jgi:hypothetical protein
MAVRVAFAQPALQSAPPAAFAMNAGKLSARPTISIPALVRMQTALRTEEGGYALADDEVHAGG